jgi:CRISPR type III-associated protein (TIGR04423 family)
MNTYWKKIDKVDDLPDLSYEGYIWMSDEKNPRKIVSKSEIPGGTQNPFIVEGYLKSTDGTVSINLVSMNGALKIHQFDLKQVEALPDDRKTNHSYITHKYDGSKIKFITVWFPEKDEVCENMEVLQPKMRVFNGFE